MGRGAAAGWGGEVRARVFFFAVADVGRRYRLSTRAEEGVRRHPRRG